MRLGGGRSIKAAGRQLAIAAGQSALTLSVLRTGRALFPHEDSWHLFLLQVESTSGHSMAGRIR
jgi:hypothetical protein